MDDEFYETCDKFYRNLLVYGVGGLIAPFIGIKLIDVVLFLLGLT